MSITETALAIRPLSPALGAEVTGIDVRELDEAGIAQVQQAFVDHRMLVIRDQELSPSEQMAFAEHWGELLVHPLTPHLEEYPPVQALENRGKAKTLNEHWHTDMSFEPLPPKLTMLHAVVVPELGGDTAFSDQYQAYESLSPGLKAMLEGVHAVHRAENLARIMGRDPKDSPSALHPVIRTHPDTGQRALYVCRSFTQHFEGMTSAESHGLLEFLFERSARPDFTYRHQWRTGDLAMWDNRCLVHYAIHDHGDEPRLMHRVTVQGEVPV